MYADVRIGEYHLDMIPFDDDVLSLELEGAYREVFLVKNTINLFFFISEIIFIIFTFFF